MLPTATNLQRNELPKATLAIIGVNFFIFILCALLPDTFYVFVVQIFGFGPRTIWNPLAPFTSMFLHGSAEHVVFNMLFLWIFGGPLEERIGRRDYLLWYFGAGIAAGLLYTFSEFARAGFGGFPGIGASGAISGVMAIYAYRCYYSKIKMLIEPVLLPIRVNIPATPLIILWFLKDLYFGFSGAATGVGHFAHIGGFIFGIVVARIKRYGLDGRIESLRMDINAKLEKGGGWDEAETGLIKLLEVAPGDAEVNHDLARLYLTRKKPDRAASHFRRAIDGYFRKSPIQGAYAVIEYADGLGKPLPLNLHLQAAKIMVEQYELEDAYKVLSLGSRQKLNSGPVTEAALALYIKLGHDLGRNVSKVAAMFNQRFPKSRQLPSLKKSLSLKPGQVFAQIRSRQEAAAKALPSRKEKASKAGIYGVAFVMEVVASPYFVLMWLVTSVLVAVFYVLGWLPGIFTSFSGLWTQLMIFAAAVFLTVEHRYRLTMNLFNFSDHPSEKQAQATFDLNLTVTQARRAEQELRFEDAAKLFEEYLTGKPDDVNMRMKLAAIYHRKLSDLKRAATHYKELTDTLERGTPFHMDALSGLHEVRAELKAQSPA